MIIVTSSVGQFCVQNKAEKANKQGAADKATINTSCSYRLQVITILDLIVADTVKTFILYCMHCRAMYEYQTLLLGLNFL